MDKTGRDQIEMPRCAPQARKETFRRKLTALAHSRAAWALLIVLLALGVANRPVQANPLGQAGEEKTQYHKKVVLYKRIVSPAETTSIRDSVLFPGYQALSKITPEIIAPHISYRAPQYLNTMAMSNYQALSTLGTQAYYSNTNVQMLLMNLSNQQYLMDLNHNMAMNNLENQQFLNNFNNTLNSYAYTNSTNNLNNQQYLNNFNFNLNFQSYLNNFNSLNNQFLNPTNTFTSPTFIQPPSFNYSPPTFVQPPTFNYRPPTFVQPPSFRWP